MRRVIFIILSAISATIFAVGLTFWVRSYFVADHFQRLGNNDANDSIGWPGWPAYWVDSIETSRGGMQYHHTLVDHQQGTPDSPPPYFKHFANKPLAYPYGTLYGTFYPPPLTRVFFDYRFRGFEIAATEHRGSDRTHERVLTLPLPFVALLSSVLPLIFLRSKRQRVRAFRLAHGLCVECGYDIRATPEKCSECGTPVHNEASA